MTKKYELKLNWVKTEKVGIVEDPGGFLKDVGVGSKLAKMRGEKTLANFAGSKKLENETILGTEVRDIPYVRRKQQRRTTALN